MGLATGAGYSRYTTKTHSTALVFESCDYMELSKPGFASSLSRKDERS